MDEGIRWYVLTHEHRDRSVDWYWALGFIALVAIGISIYFSNILFALILVIGALSIGALVARGPREHEVHVHGRGISVDGTLYPYKSLQSFWVAVDEPYVFEEDEEEFEYEPRANLLLTTGSYIHPRFSLPLPDLDHAQEVRDYLAEYMAEEEQQPHLGEHVANLLGL
jgi:hypothetical protein